MQLTPGGLLQAAIVDHEIHETEHFGRRGLAVMAKLADRYLEGSTVRGAQQLFALGGAGLQQGGNEIEGLGHWTPRVARGVSMASEMRVNAAAARWGRQWTRVVRGEVKIGRRVVQLRRPLAMGGLGLAVAAAGVAAWFTLLQPAEGAPTIARAGAAAPQISLPVVGGGTSNLAAERGKVVLVNFWATWCEPCKSEMPGLQRLADELRDRPFVLYSVDLQEDAAQVEAFQRDFGLSLFAVLDQDGDVTRAYGVRALPATFLIDRTGVLRQQRLGPLLPGSADTLWSEPWLAAQVRSLLATG
jgi:thiol-disulfide isomerase/thioredoxin